MKNTTMKDAVVMVKKWAENRKGYRRELSDCFWDLDTLLVEKYGMCGEWYGSNETEPTPNQYRKLKDVIAEVYHNSTSQREEVQVLGQHAGEGN